MLKKILGALLSLALLAGAAAGYLVFRHGQEVARHRAVVDEKVRGISGEKLGPDEACWLARAHFFANPNDAGRDPLVACEGALVEVPNGYRLKGIRTSTTALQLRHYADLCLGRGAGGRWLVLGRSYKLDDCRSLPASGGTDPAAAARAVMREKIGRQMATARTAIVEALAAPAPGARCEGLPALAPANTPVIDERRLDPTYAPMSGVGSGVPGDGRIQTCLPDAKVDALTDLVCHGEVAWTHALVVRPRTFEPPKVDSAEGTFSGGRIDGELWLVDLAQKKPLCRGSFEAKMPKVVSEHGENSAFAEAAKKALAESAQRLTGYPLVY